MENFRKLIVWQRAHQFVLAIYKLTNQFPKAEQYALISQIQRAAVSIAANIAEGSKRQTGKDRRHFLLMAETSLEEVKYYLILAADLSYCSVEDSDGLMEIAREVGRLITGFSRSIH